MDSHEPLEVYSTNNANQAELVRAMLESEGIRVSTGRGESGWPGRHRHV